TDGDGATDLQEILAGTDPTNPDADTDGLSDGAEGALGTSNGNPDTDGDGIWDGAEVFLGLDPLMTTTNAQIPPGSLFTQARGPSCGHFLALVNETNSTYGLLGKPNLGSGFGFAFSDSGVLYIAQYTRLAVCPDPLHASSGGNLVTTNVGDFGSPDGRDVH